MQSKLCIVRCALEFTWMLIGWILFQQRQSDSYFGRVYLELQISEQLVKGHVWEVKNLLMGPKCLSSCWAQIPLSTDCILWAGRCGPVGVFVVSEDSLANSVLRGWRNIRIGLSVYLCYYQEGDSDKFVGMLHHKWQYFAWWKAFKTGVVNIPVFVVFSVWCAMGSEWYRDLHMNRIFYCMWPHAPGHFLVTSLARIFILVSFWFVCLLSSWTEIR